MSRPYLVSRAAILTAAREQADAARLLTLSATEFEEGFNTDITQRVVDPELVLYCAGVLDATIQHIAYNLCSLLYLIPFEGTEIVVDVAEYVKQPAETRKGAHFVTVWKGTDKTFKGPTPVASGWEL